MVAGRRAAPLRRRRLVGCGVAWIISCCPFFVCATGTLELSAAVLFLFFDETLPKRPASRAYLHLPRVCYVNLNLCPVFTQLISLLRSTLHLFIVCMAKPVSSRK